MKLIVPPERPKRILSVFCVHQYNGAVPCLNCYHGLSYDHVYLFSLSLGFCRGCCKNFMFAF